MRRFTSFSVFFLSLTLFFSTVQAAEKRNQLEELLIWKISDELKLSTAEEKKFSDIVRDINTRKSRHNQELQASIGRMSKAANTKEKEAELTLYRKSLQNYGRINEEEFDRLKTVFGTERMAQYLHIKQDLTNRIKGLLVTPEAAPRATKPLPQPKLIEEK